jgi:hypothetical protein
VEVQLVPVWIEFLFAQLDVALVHFSFLKRGNVACRDTSFAI